jgi:hypothetical protein
MDENGIRRSIPENDLMVHHPLVHLFHTQRITKYKAGVKARSGAGEVLGDSLRTMPSQSE